MNSKCTKVECERPSDTKPKDQKMPLLKLWLVLILTLIFALVSLTASHLTHSLTLRVEAYHSLYNLMALTGCLITIKVKYYKVALEPAAISGGYTHHQGCFLKQRNSGVWAQSRICGEAVQAGMRALMSLVIVIIWACILLWEPRPMLAHYIDPVVCNDICFYFAVFIVLVYFFTGKECCQILLQTIPGNIDVQTLSAKLLQEFPEIVNIHHLHIWSLTPGKVTLQPEFVHYASSNPSEVGSNECLLRCSNDLCRQKECCDDQEKEDSEDAELQRVTIVDQNKTQSETIQETSSSPEAEISPTEDKTKKYWRKTISKRSSSLDLGSKIPSKDLPFRKTRSKEDLKDLPEKIKRSMSCNLNISGEDSLRL
ncbi:hypothetical protein Avbf_08537 [Armadillidium vulgare]|nr:hypothetical protein Avbf_08537 [Armadillidium vulgare]